MAQFKVTKKAASKLLEQLGYVNVGQMKTPAVQTALRKLDETLDDAAESKVKDAGSIELLKKLKVAIAKGDDIVLSDDESAKKPAEKPKSKPAQPAPDDEDDEQDDGDLDDGSDDREDFDEDEEEDDEEPEEKAPAKPAKPAPVKKPAQAPAKPQKAASAKAGAATSKPSKPAPKSSGGPKRPRPGVYLDILELLEKSSKTKPATEDAILKVLKQKHKDRNADSMLTTLKDALRRTLKARYKLTVKTNDKGGWWVDK